MKNKKILISDPTLRDGNHAVSHQINKSSLAKYCKAADNAGVPIVEVGHGNGLGASSILVGESLVSDEKIITTARKNLLKSQLGVHAIPGFCTIDKDMKMAVENGVDVFRIASHCTESDITKKHIEFVRKHDKRVFGVLMMTHMVKCEELVIQALKIQSYGAHGVIIMDSAGSFIPNEVKQRIKKLVNVLSIDVGFHAHNNLGMGIANSIAAVEAGATIVDGTSCGFGAGAGNAQLEVLVAVLSKMGFDTGIDLYKILDVSEVAIKELIPVLPYISSLSIISGLSGVFSGFVKEVKKVSKINCIDPRDVFFELGKLGAVAGQESMISEVAYKLKNKKNQSQEFKF